MNERGEVKPKTEVQDRKGAEVKNEREVMLRKLLAPIGKYAVRT